MSTQERMKRAASIVSAALFDLGYSPDVFMRVENDNLDGFQITVQDSTVPNAVVWTAFKLANLTLPCFSCFQAHLGNLSWFGDSPYDECIAGSCAFPDLPREPSKDELVFGRHKEADHEA